MSDAYNILQNTFGSNGSTVEKTGNGMIIRNNIYTIYDVSFLATLVERGPVSISKDFNDERYWALAIYPFVTKIDQPLPSLELGDSTQTATYWWGSATNLCEVKDHSHLSNVGKVAVNPGTPTDPPGQYNNLILGDVVTIHEIKVFDKDGWVASGYYFSNPIGKIIAKITNVTGTFPVWNYTLKKISHYNSTLTDDTALIANTNKKWVPENIKDNISDGSGVGAITTSGLNRCEWVPYAYPFLHGNGIKVITSDGLISNSYTGDGTSNCRIRAIGIGSVVDVSVDLDYGTNPPTPVYSFYAPNSAQPD